MTRSAPTPADQRAMTQLSELIAYADETEQTLLAAILSEAADALNNRLFMSRPDND